MFSEGERKIPRTLSKRRQKRSQGATREGKMRVGFSDTLAMV